MAKMKFLAAMAAVLILACGQSRAASDLPPDCISPDTVFVIHADAQHLTPALLKAAFFTVLGDNFERVKDFNAKFQDRYDRATKAGLESMTIVGTSSQRVADAENEVAGDYGADGRRRSRPLNPPVVYYRLKAGADAATVEAVMTQDMPEKQKQDVQFEQMDNWIVQHETNQTPPDKLDADRAKLFDEAFATSKDAAVVLVFICDARTSKEMNNAAKRDASPKLMKSAFPILSASKWMMLSMKLGNNPGLYVDANTADVNSAHQLRLAVDAALDDFKQQINNPGDNAGAMLIIGPMISPLLDGFKPTSNGAVVSMSLKGDALNSLANMFLTFRAMTAPPPGQPVPATRPAR